MELTNLKSIERWNVLLGALLLLACLVLRASPRFLLGVATGAAIAIGNFTAIRRIVEWALRRSREGAGDAGTNGGGTLGGGLIALALLAKMVLLMATVTIVLRFLPVQPIAFLLGLSIFLVSIGIESCRFAFAERPRDVQP